MDSRYKTWTSLRTGVRHFLRIRMEQEKQMLPYGITQRIMLFHLLLYSITQTKRYVFLSKC